MAVRPASPIGSLAIFAARVTGFLGTSFTPTLSRMAGRGWYGSRPGECRAGSAHGGTRLGERPPVALGVGGDVQRQAPGAGQFGDDRRPAGPGPLVVPGDVVDVD